jgi:phosphoadenosine phosphosulfate reductase
MDEAERKRYLLHAALPAFDRRIEQARRKAEAGLVVMRHPYIALSFGKDSTVMAHILLSCWPQLPVLYVNCGQWDEWPDTPRVKAAFLRRCPCAFTELTGPSIVEAYISAGGLYVQDEEATPTARRAQREYGLSLTKILDAEAQQRGYDGVFVGLRREESDNRARLFATRGTLYWAATRQQWICHPLADWHAADVWAYIVRHELPYNELYDLAPEGRERARNGAMMGTRSARHGRLVFLKRMYPDWFNQLAARFPEVRAYV